MVKAADKKKAFALFLRGFSIRQIAQKIEISRSTIERWSTREEWCENRDAFQHEAQRITAKRLLDEDPKRFYDSTLIAVDELRRSFIAITAARNRRYTNKTVKRLFRDALRHIVLYDRLVNAEFKYLQQRKTAEEILQMFNERQQQNFNSSLVE